MGVRIFLSYRRGESDIFVGRVYDTLTARFGRDNVFLDIDSLTGGRDFRPELVQYISRASVVVSVIGSDWCGDVSTDRWIMSDKDYVAMECVAAVERGIPIIPVYFRREVLAQSDLPSTLHSLCFANSFFVRRERDFHPFTKELSSAIVKLSRPTLSSRSLWYASRWVAQHKRSIIVFLTLILMIIATRDFLARMLVTEDGVETILESRDAQAFQRRAGVTFEVARAVPKRQQLLRETDFDDVLRATKQTFDMQTLTAETITNRFEILQELIDRGVQVRILVWDPNSANEQNMRAYSEEIDKGGDIAMQEMLAVMSRNAKRLSEMRSRTDLKGSVQVRFWRGPARHTMWIRDRDNPTHAVAHCEIIFRGDSFANPIFRVGTLSPQTLHGFREQFAVLWNSSVPP